MNFKAFENKVWLSSPTMHGEEMEYVKENFDYDAVIEWHEDVYKCALNRKNEKRWEQNC